MQTQLSTDLTTQWIDAKAAEEAAKQNRLAIEAAICTSLNVAPGATETFYPVPGFKVRFAINRSVPAAEQKTLREAYPDLAPELQNVFRWIAEVIPAEFDAVVAAHPSAAAALSPFITTKDAKPAFTFTPPKAQPPI
jgi:hypothetical protein